MCALTPAMRLLALKLDLVDRPVGNKIHAVATPLMGGAGVYLGFALAVAIFLPITGPVRGVLAGGGVAAMVGLLDEWLTLPPLLHLAGQVGAALVAVVAGVGILHTVSVPTAGFTSPGFALPAAVGAVLTLLWLVGMMNTMNFLDGLDGLTAGVSAIAALILAAWAAEEQRFSILATAHHADLLLPLALAGALMGFLIFNWHPAKIFLGDSGTMFLGIAIAAIAIVGPTKLGTALLVLIIPVLDVAWAIVRRQLRGRNFLSGDKQHVYHRMMELGMSHTSTVLTLYLLVSALAVVAFVLSKAQKLIAFVVFAVVLSLAFVFLELRANQMGTPSVAEPSPHPEQRPS